MSNKLRRVYDPLYGVTQLSELEFSIISSPEIQRLRYVRMCNINSLLVTGASEISRFEHILGVLRLTKEWIASQGDYLSEREAEELCAAALIHDFQTGPFGHSLQYVLEDNESDENFVHDDIRHGGHLRFHQSSDASASFAGRPFNCSELLSTRWANVTALIRGEGELGPLISGTVDLDNIDNVVRLAYHVGVANSKDADVAVELAKDIIPTEAGFEVSSNSIGLVERWQNIRRRLYELLLLDWGEFSAKAMLTRAMELAIEYELIGTDSWLRTDLELYDYLEKVSVGKGQEIGELVKRIRCGDLYEPAILIRSKSVDLYEKFSNISSKRELEKEITDLAKEKLNLRLRLVLHPILDVKKTDRALDVIVRETGSPVTIGCNSSQLLIGVFLARPVESDQKNRNLKKLLEGFLIGQGLEDVRLIDDPMSVGDENQMELL